MLSSDTVSHSTRAPPKLKPDAYNFWKLHFRASQAAKGTLHVLEPDGNKMPVLDQSRVNSLRRQGKHEEADAYVSAFHTRLATWIRNNATCYNDLVTAGEDEYEARTAIMENVGATAAELLTQYDAIYDIKDNPAIIQSKVSAFTSMDMDSSSRELASKFAGRISRARLELIESGSEQEWVKLDIHGVSRLKECLIHDSRYASLGHVLRSQPNITWDEACRQIRDFERSNLLHLTSSSGSDSKPSARSLSDGQPVEKLCRMLSDVIEGKTTKPGKRPENSRKHIQCYNCKGFGHMAAACKKKTPQRNKKRNGRSHHPAKSSKRSWHSKPRKVNFASSTSPHLRMMRVVPSDPSASMSDVSDSESAITSFSDENIVLPDDTDCLSTSENAAMSQEEPNGSSAGSRSYRDVVTGTFPPYPPHQLHVCRGRCCFPCGCCTGI